MGRQKTNVVQEINVIKMIVLFVVTVYTLYACGKCWQKVMIWPDLLLVFSQIGDTGTDGMSSMRTLAWLNTTFHVTCVLHKHNIHMCNVCSDNIREKNFIYSTMAKELMNSYPCLW